MKIFIIVIFACFLFILSGCQKNRIEIVESDSALVPIFKSETGFIIDSVEILEKKGENWDSSRPIWSLYAKRIDHTQKLNELKYGEVPYGFDEIHKAKVLEYGKTYRIFFRRGDTGVSAYFIITIENGFAAIKRLNLNP